MKKRADVEPDQLEHDPTSSPRRRFLQGAAAAVIAATAPNVMLADGSGRVVIVSSSFMGFTLCEHPFVTLPSNLPLS
jgi:hypothetical protein